ncbi:MAG TPA: threonine--tRNA ligase, partial [Nitrospiraceae bacterium]|nr:threonine--tRNA ligase [Nitrospiraceae bacterium]
MPIETHQIQITLPDGTSQKIPAGYTAGEALRRAGGALAHEVLAVKVNGVPRDLTAILTEDVSLEPLTFESQDGKDVYRHSSTHIMAQAVKEVFPSAQLAIGPAIEEGFYYDFAFDRPFTPEDLEKIEARAHEIMKANFSFKRIEMPRQDAIRYFRERGENYKVDILEHIEDQTASLYSQGEFVDLCRGPHVPSTGRIGALKLLSSAGAYWRGDERNPMLQRIYGTAFPTQAELDAHLAKLEEIKRRDHRKLGK